MTPEQLALVRATLAEIEAHSDAFSESFYAHLFTLAPEARTLFRVDMAEQRGKLFEEFSFLAEVVSDLPAFVKRARDLGGRQHHYGVRPHHYEVMEHALLGALSLVLGPLWNPATMLAWQRLYRLMAETMLEGAAGAALVGPTG